MTRIIAGELGGRRIAVPAKGTRPTTDRVREAVFSRLDHAGALHGARVLDLFAGSGALAFEALSRGAAEATLVEASAPAARLIVTNVSELGLDRRARVVREKVGPFVARSDAKWDLALLDPPYDIRVEELSRVLEALVPRLVSGATVVLELATRAGDAPWPHAILPVASKRYGETTVHYGELADEAMDEGTGSVVA